ncbi:hypothetical protein BDY21DRAFT_336486 [Lineolata rhizophorae]|uniref:Uncharacterized protein n=1 Tax=Lineolata rhizophorae TaxID=578093 RepID=A0A6A6P755_9PEZI|nr:hypothetical protein BDY21DRAFT_336486 [Lineolata rhizophorae]
MVTFPTMPWRYPQQTASARRAREERRAEAGNCRGRDRRPARRPLWPCANRPADVRPAGISDEASSACGSDGADDARPELRPHPGLCDGGVNPSVEPPRPHRAGPLRASMHRPPTRLRRCTARHTGHDASHPHPARSPTSAAGTPTAVPFAVSCYCSFPHPPPRPAPIRPAPSAPLWPSSYCSCAYRQRQAARSGPTGH